MEEIWREIPGYEGFYAASSFGRIKSLSRFVKNKNGLVRKNGKILAPGFNKTGGYYVVNLSRYGKTKMQLVSRLVAFAFPEICGEYFDGADIDHCNGLKTDNRPENLRWVSHKMNMNNPNTKTELNNRENQSKWIIKLSLNNEILHFYPSLGEAERETGISKSNISKCCRLKVKSAGGYLWKYAI